MGKNAYAYSCSLLCPVQGLCIPSHQSCLPADVGQGSSYSCKGTLKHMCICCKVSLCHPGLKNKIILFMFSEFPGSLRRKMLCYHAHRPPVFVGYLSCRVQYRISVFFRFTVPVTLSRKIPTGTIKHREVSWITKMHHYVLVFLHSLCPEGVGGIPASK